MTKTVTTVSRTFTTPNGKQVETVINGEAWVKVTGIPEMFGKRLSKFMDMKGTKDYIKLLQEKADKSNTSIASPNVGVRSESGFPDVYRTYTGGYQRGGITNNVEQGTWFCPKLAIDLARWCSLEFHDWCNDIILELQRNGFVSVRRQTEEEKLRLALASRVNPRIEITEPQKIMMSAARGHYARNYTGSAKERFRFDEPDLINLVVLGYESKDLKKRFNLDKANENIRDLMNEFGLEVMTTAVKVNNTLLERDAPFTDRFDRICEHLELMYDDINTIRDTILTDIESKIDPKLTLRESRYIAEKGKYPRRCAQEIAARLDVYALTHD